MDLYSMLQSWKIASFIHCVTAMDVNPQICPHSMVVLSRLSTFPSNGLQNIFI